MSYLQLPRGDARAIASARAKGQKPAGAVEIVLAGGWYESPNPVCYADPDQIYRWDWLAGLYVVIIIGQDTKLNRILADIDRANPLQIDVLDRDRRIGWLINSITPGIKATRWPKGWVADWLDGGTWHQELAQVKADALKAAEAKRQTTQNNEQEPVWN